MRQANVLAIDAGAARELAQLVSDPIYSVAAGTVRQRPVPPADPALRPTTIFLVKRMRPEMPRSASRRETKRRWFDFGARAVAALRPDLPAGYICPLCTALFDDIDALTLEDVPPK